MDGKETIALRIKELEEKFARENQDPAAYLEGLLYTEYLSYWDYVHLDTLLTLQKPKTAIPDEKIFIIYHQITELYFNLCRHELDQLAEHGSGNAGFIKERVHRINRYFEALTVSFDVMIHGMEQEQFLKFRMALMPASGFQSAQYRMIEIACTDLINLVDKEHRGRFINREDAGVEELFEFIYWKAGATEASTGAKTLTLRQFEQKYTAQLVSLCYRHRSNNLLKLFESLGEKEQAMVADEYRQLDVNVNINWPLVHYKSAARYLQRNPNDIAATGGTNWQKYLPPRFQKRIFYPSLWSESERAEWGKSWVEKMLDLRRENI